MTISTRIFVAVAVVLFVSAVLVQRVFQSETFPLMKQAAEEILIDSSRMLASLSAQAGCQSDGSLHVSTLKSSIEQFEHTKTDASVHDASKRKVDLVVYLTDLNGRVVYHSNNQEIGKDYSRWRDVRLTLQGKYGARTTRIPKGDGYTSVMYVGAPILCQGKVVGVASVGKHNQSLLPYYYRARNRTAIYALLVLGVSIVAVWVVSRSIGRQVGSLKKYVMAVASGRREKVPELPMGGELSVLAQNVEVMRQSIDSRTHMEAYVQTLTHELKSPLTAIRAYGELLSGEVSREDTVAFSERIVSECDRIQNFSDKLLALTGTENADSVRKEAVDVAGLVEAGVRNLTKQASQKGIVVQVRVPKDEFIQGDAALLRIAFENILSNAIEFSPAHAEVQVEYVKEPEAAELRVVDQGPGISKENREKVFEKFFSTARPGTGRRSSGLGLSLVRAIAKLHGGSIELRDRLPHGLEAALRLPT